jgi:hypothetical protein
MQLRLQTLMLLLAAAPPALAWVWVHLALIAPFAPLLGFATLGAAIVTMVLLDSDSV